MHSVLFVCTANICRSPMAVGLLRNIVQNEHDQWLVESAGVWAQKGNPAAPNTIVVLQNRGIDLSDHRSRGITHDMVRSFNLVLTMERGHKEALRMAFMDCVDRILLFNELIDRFDDVTDPIGLSLADFEETAQEMEDVLNSSIEKIRLLSADSLENEKT